MLNSRISNQTSILKLISKRKFFTIDAKAPYEMTCAAHLSFNRYIQERKLPAAFNPAAPFYSLDKYEFFSIS